METEEGSEMSAERDGRDDNMGEEHVGRGGGAVLLSTDVDLKLAVGAYTYRERGLDESSADTPEQEQEMDTAEVDEKGRKRKKHRRTKPNKRTWLRRADLAGRDDSPSSLRRLRGLRSSAFVHSQPAPNNTTQFIMEDHTDLQSLDAEITAREVGSRTTRVRDSSFSIDSDSDLSSSPEDEAYLSKEFANTYEDVHVERLGTMSKVDLIQEYLQLEQRVDILEKKLRGSQNTSSATNDSGGNGGTGTDSDSEVAEGEMPLDPATAEKIRIFQEEIQKLVVENNQLVQENQRLQSSGSLVRPSSSLSTSIDSESDSSTSSGSSSSGSSGRSDCSRVSQSFDVIPESYCGNKSSNADMASTGHDVKELGFSSEGQDMETENSKEGQLSTEPMYQDGSVVSSVIAH